MGIIDKVKFFYTQCFVLSVDIYEQITVSNYKRKEQSQN